MPNENNIVIRSEQRKQGWRRQFSYSIDDQNHAPEFFYATAHADRIIARIKPPFIDFVFTKTQENLRGYGIITPIELLVIEDQTQKSQVILDCVKFSRER